MLQEVEMENKQIAGENMLKLRNISVSKNTAISFKNFFPWQVSEFRPKIHATLKKHICPDRNHEMIR